MENKQIVINMFGGPGCGKSTTAAGLFALLKMSKVSCELVTEYAKDCVWRGDYKPMGLQYYISAMQRFKQEVLKKKVEVIITDSPILLGLHYGNPAEKTKHFDEDLVEAFHRYDNVNFFLRRTKGYDPMGRRGDFESAKTVDTAVQGILAEHCLNVQYTTGDAGGVNFIYYTICQKLRVDPKFIIERR